VHIDEIAVASANDFLGMSEDCGARPDGNTSVESTAWLSPVPSHLLFIIEEQFSHVGISNKIPLPQSTVIRVGAQVPHVERIYNDISTL
jgi:hypothetical protein